MKWVKRTAYSIGSGEFVICRTVHSGADLYTLWQGMTSVGDYSTAARAKQAAEERAA